jgi:hypothetical protein
MVVDREPVSEWCELERSKAALQDVCSTSIAFVLGVEEEEQNSPHSSRTCHTK